MHFVLFYFLSSRKGPGLLPEGQRLIYTLMYTYACTEVIIIISSSNSLSMFIAISTTSVTLSRGSAEAVAVLEALGSVNVVMQRYLSGYSLQWGAVGGECSGWRQYYLMTQHLTSYKSLHPVSTAPPFDES